MNDRAQTENTQNAIPELKNLF